MHRRPIYGDSDSGQLGPLLEVDNAVDLRVVEKGGRHGPVPVDIMEGGEHGPLPSQYSADNKNVGGQRGPLP
eukprot:9775822-Karenia_brevis.AAC.1